MSKLSILGVCGGNGVMLYPFKERLIGNIEPRAIFYTQGQKQWNSNFNVPMVKTIKEFPLKGKVDVIIGAPNCGASSMLHLSRKKAFGNPKKDKSLNLFFKSIKKFKPKMFLMENLSGLLKIYAKEDLQKLFKEYHLKFIEGSVSMFGNSQKSRKRLIVVGSRKRRWLKVAKPFKVTKLRTCGALLRGAEKHTGYHREDLDALTTMYAGYKCTLRKARYEWLEKRKGDRRWKVYDRKFTTAPGVYINRENDYPVTARKANRQFNHHGLTMTPRELARIQGVPDEFDLYFEENKSTYWINKGRVTVTKCAPYQVGLWFSKILKTCGI